MSSDGKPLGPHRAEYLVTWGSAYTFELPHRPEWATEELTVWPDRVGTGGRVQLRKTHNRLVIDWTLTLQLADPSPDAPVTDDEFTGLVWGRAFNALRAVVDRVPGAAAALRTWAAERDAVDRL